MNSSIRFAAVLAAASTLASPAAGQDLPLVLRVPATARIAAFGDAFAAGTGADAVFANPARLGTSGLSLGLSRYGRAATQATAASTTALGSLSVAVTARWLDYGTNGLAARPGALTERGVAERQSLVAGLAAARNVFGIRVGAGINYLEERLPNGPTRGTSVDLGASKAVAGVTFALSAQHLGSALDIGPTTVSLPSRVTAAAAVQRKTIGAYFDLSAAAAVSRERDGTIVPGGGVELLYEPVGGFTGALRVGARRVDGSGVPALQAITVGAGFGIDRFSFDYTFESYRGPGAAHRFGIRIG